MTVVAVAGACLGPIAAAAEGPSLFGSIALEVQNDWTRSAGEPGRDELFTTVDVEVGLRVTRELSLRSKGVFEHVVDPEADDSRFFEDQEVLLETLIVQYQTDRFSLYGGKFIPRFGVAWEVAPGLYGDDFASDYELIERNGFGGSITVDDAGTGTFTLAASAFFRDTGPLAGSVGTGRGRFSRSDGGASNTGRPDSFALALHGTRIARLPGLNYEVAILHQAAGKGDSHDELGLQAALYGSFDVGHDITLEPILEYVELSHADAGPDDVRIATAGSALLWGSWNLAVVGALRATTLPGGGSVTDRLVQISAGYAFDSGIAIGIGYKAAETDNVDADTVGVLLSYELDF